MPEVAVVSDVSKPHSTQQEVPPITQLADWYLSGQLFADPAELLRQLLAAHRSLEGQYQTALDRLWEAHDQLCGCDLPADEGRCSAPKETWGAFEYLGEREKPICVSELGPIYPSDLKPPASEGVADGLQASAVPAATPPFVVEQDNANPAPHGTAAQGFAVVKGDSMDTNPAISPEAICPSCGGDAADNWFDRTLCTEGDMHTRCKNCGFALDGCGDESPAKERDDAH